MSISPFPKKVVIVFLWFSVLLSTQQASAYGVLTHQAVIDAAWPENIKPLLLHRFPKATEEELRNAHAYAYGGSIIQDMGYYPFGNDFFTELLHYVRSGDFVQNLISLSDNLNEFAFALGALAHYNADIYGHPIGTNKAVPLVYPGIRKEHGDEVTYADDPLSHIKTEFGFDVLQVARGHYAPEAYQEFIGFEVAQEVLERAFQKTYGIELSDIFFNLPLALNTYRYTVRGLFPELTKAAWQAKKEEIQAAQPGVTRRNFTYRMSRPRFHEQWGKDYERPNFLARVLAWLIRILPKIGPLRHLAFKVPTPEAEKLFMQSFNVTVEKYSNLLGKLRKDQHNLQLQNLQLDTGKPVKAGAYELTDEAYAELLEELTRNGFKHLTPELQQHILYFYKDLNAPLETKEDKDEWQRTLNSLEKLKEIEL